MRLAQHLFQIGEHQGLRQAELQRIAAQPMIRLSDSNDLNVIPMQGVLEKPFWCPCTNPAIATRSGVASAGVWARETNGIINNQAAMIASQKYLIWTSHAKSQPAREELPMRANLSALYNRAGVRIQQIFSVWSVDRAGAARRAIASSDIVPSRFETAITCHQNSLNEIE